MVKNSQGNAGKDQVRCTSCGFMNARRAQNRYGALIAATCMRCGAWIIANRPEWDRLHWGLEVVHDDENRRAL